MEWFFCLTGTGYNLKLTYKNRQALGAKKLGRLSPRASDLEKYFLPEEGRENEV